MVIKMDLTKYGINNDNPLLNIALTHSSYANEHNKEDYERLEYLGDAVLELVMSEYFYKNTELKEGEMTKRRSRYVCEEACATYSKELKFDDYILLGSGEAEANETILADVFESFVGATYLDQGFSFTKELVLGIIVKYIKSEIDFLHDYKSELQELVQTVKKSVIYEIIDEQGPAHDKTFTCQVKVDNLVMGIGKGSSKKQAEQEAAKVALSKQVKE